MLQQKHFELKQTSLFYNNTGKAEKFHVVHGKVALLKKRRSEHGTNLGTKLATTPKDIARNFKNLIGKRLFRAIH